MDAISRLHAVDFLSLLNARDLSMLASICRREFYIAGDDIIQQGDATDRFFVVDEGAVHFRKTDFEGFEHPAGSKGPGEHFGMAMFASQEPMQATAEALGQAALYVISREDFDRLVQAYPEILTRMPAVAEARHKLTLGYKWLTPGETIALVVFRHTVAIIPKLLPPALLALLTAGALLALDLSQFGLAWDLSLLVGIVGFSAALLWALYNIIDWRDDDFIVTNKRVVHAERKVFLAEERDEIPINRIQTMSVVKAGPLETALGIGSLEIRSAGQENRILFDHIPDPERTRLLIQRQVSLLRAQQRAVERERFRNRVSKELRHYVLKLPMEEDKVQVLPVVRRSVWKQARDLKERIFAYEVRRGETITWRKHWFGLVRHAKSGLFFSLGLILLAILYPLILERFAPLVPFTAAFLVLLLADIGVVAYGVEDWRNDIYMVTDRAILDIERKPFGLGETSKEALLLNVQDARSLRPSLLNTLLDFGNVEVQTAGGGEGLIFYDVARPQDIVAEIFRHRELFELNRRERETSIESRNVVDAIVAYHRLLMQERHQVTEQVETTTTVEEAEIPPAPPEGELTPGDESPPPVISYGGDEVLAEFPPPEEVE